MVGLGNSIFKGALRITAWVEKGTGEALIKEDRVTEPKKDDDKKDEKNNNTASTNST